MTFRTLAACAALLLGLSLSAAEAAVPSAALHAQAREGLLKTPVYRAILKYFPDSFTAIETTMAQAFADGHSSHEVMAAGQKVYLKLLAREIPKADNANSRELLGIVRAEARAALDQGPVYCLNVLGQAPTDSLPVDYLPPALIAKELDWASRLFEQTATRPAPAPATVEKQDLERAAIAAYDALPDPELRAAFMSIGGDAKKARTPTEQRAACLFSINLFDQFLAAPGDSGIELYRGLEAAAH